MEPMTNVLLGAVAALASAIAVIWRLDQGKMAAAYAAAEADRRASEAGRLDDLREAAHMAGRVLVALDRVGDQVARNSEIMQRVLDLPSMQGPPPPRPASGSREIGRAWAESLSGPDLFPTESKENHA